MNRTNEIRNEFESIMKGNSFKDLNTLEKEAYMHLQDFYADEDKEFEEACELWREIVLAKRS